MADRDPRTVTLKGVRLSFTDALVEARAKSDDQPDKKTHHLNFINESSSKHYDDNNRKIMAAIKAACDKEWKDPERYKTIIEDAPKRVCFRDGSKFKNKEGKAYAGYEGNKAFGASGPNGGKKRPKLLDRHKRDVEVKDIGDVMYSGSYADAIVSFFGTEKGSPGVFCTCELIRSHQTGDAMAGGYRLDASDIDELDDLDDDGLTSGGSSDDLDDLL